ncbi:MAG: sensor histidine kinase [Coprococcus sp.]
MKDTSNNEELQLQSNSNAGKKLRISQQAVIFIIITVCVAAISLIISSAMTTTVSSKNNREFEKSIKNNSEYLMYVLNGCYSADGNFEGAKDTINAMASACSGRVMLVDNLYKVVLDSYNEDTGKYMIDRDIQKIMNGEITDVHYIIENQYQYIYPIVNNEGYIDAVAVIAARMDALNELNEHTRQRAHIIEIMFVIIGGLLGYFISYLSVRDIKCIKRKLGNMKDGLNEQIEGEGLFAEAGALTDDINHVFAKAQLLEESRQEFVSNVSHELKTPITSMKVLSESILMQENVPAEMYREFMNDIVQEIDREAQIISDLLTLVKTDKGPESLNFESVNMNELMEVILKRLKPLAEKRNIVITFESFREVTADIDKVKFTLAISNLIENGIKYNVDGGWIKVSLNADHKNLYIKVADSGVGIPEDCIEHIFERFYRVDKARSRDTGGTGLGLAITKNIIAMHRGTINVYSEPGKGTTFTVKVPMNYIGNK